MKKKRKITALFLAAALMWTSMQVRAQEDLERIRLAEEGVGKTALVWKYTDSGTMGEFLGIWECSDTGFGADSDGDGMGSIQEGRVIDMYFPTQEEVEEWMDVTGSRVYVQLVDAKG